MLMHGTLRPQRMLELNLALDPERLARVACTHRIEIGCGSLLT